MKRFAVMPSGVFRPHIACRDGLWWCSDGWGIATGRSPQEAYRKLHKFVRPTVADIDAYFGRQSAHDAA